MIVGNMRGDLERSLANLRSTIHEADEVLHQIERTIAGETGSREPGQGQDLLQPPRGERPELALSRFSDLSDFTQLDDTTRAQLVGLLKAVHHLTLDNIAPLVEQAERASTSMAEPDDSADLLTTTEAARELGIRSINTLKALIKTEGIPFTRNGNRIMLSRSQVEALKERRRVSHIRTSDRMWDEVDKAFGSDPMTQPEMDAVSRSRPGTLPWKRP